MHFQFALVGGDGSRAMGHTIVGSLLPAAVTLLLGFVAARRHEFSKQHAAILNRLALGYALPFFRVIGSAITLAALIALTS